MKCPICSSEDLRPYKHNLCCYGCGKLLNSQGYAQCDECGEHDMSVAYCETEGECLCDQCYASRERYIDWPRGVNIQL